MEKKVIEKINELRTIVERIDFNNTGWQSVFRRKKYAKIEFVHSIEDIIEEQQILIGQLMGKIEEGQREIERQDQKICQIEEHITGIDMMVKQGKRQLDELLEYRKNNEKYKEQLERQLGATARQLMKVKWELIDRDAQYTESDGDILHCKICGYKAKRGNFETKTAKCCFNGGKLVRYLCPECGVIFGPTKFSDLSQDEINDDYTVHYLGFHEGDSTQKELDAFYMLKPEKNKLYLNYGCGSWSKSLEYLRQEGYQVFGYEPYAPEAESPYMITSRETICKMRFDGIFSNDVIEHFMNPVQDFIFMKNLLKDKHSRMAHSTSCYIYKYEITRFHTHFFTGKSIDMLCKKTGLNIVERVNEVDTKDFICYVYEPEEVNLDYTEHLCGLTKEENQYILKPDKIMYGPYLTLGGGKYQWILEIGELPEESDNLFCRITEQAGKGILKQIKMMSGKNVIEIDVPQIVFDMEFVVENTTGHEIQIKGLKIQEETEKYSWRI